jgi:hypothetical protein
MDPRAGLDGCRKSRPPPPHSARIRSPDRPVRSESLYRLSYLGGIWGKIVSGLCDVNCFFPRLNVLVQGLNMWSLRLALGNGEIVKLLAGRRARCE